MSEAIIYRVRREYQMRFKEVLEHYASLRMSVRATARDLGISHTHLRRLADRFGVQFNNHGCRTAVAQKEESCR